MLLIHDLKKKRKKREEVYMLAYFVQIKSTI